MAPLFASSHAAHASLLLLSPNPTAAARVRVGGLRVRQPRRLRLPVRLAAGAGTPDPTVDDDEWGRERPASGSANSQPSDEWGEPGVPEPEQPSGADTPTNDDEWGGEPTPTPPPAKAVEPPASEEDSGLEELKRCLADTVYGSGLGLQASTEVRGEVVELVAQLEAANPTSAPVQASDLLDGNWILLYTAYSELLPILLAGATPFSKVEKISQEIDSRSLTIVNASTISTPFASFSFSATASFEAQSPSRIEEIGEEELGVEVKGRSMAEKPKKLNRAYLAWTPEMDTALLAILVEYHNNGDHAQNGWKPHVYNACIKHVKETCNVVINKDKIVARIKTFDKHYDIISKILAQSGFGWDWENNMVSVESDEVWSRYVEANKDAAPYRTKEVKNWQAIQTIYSKDHATGAGARTGSECAQAQDAPVADGAEVVEDTPEAPKKRPRTADAILSMVGELRCTFNDALKSTEPPPMTKVTPPSEILAALKNIYTDLEGPDMLRAYGKLTANERTFESLMALPEDLRKPWLLSLP